MRVPAWSTGSNPPQGARVADAGGRLGRRLGRILVLLPYAIQHPGVSVSELARKFGISKKDLLDDLNLVFMCGLPGYGPGDLIDVELQEDHVYVRTADYFSAPLRLSPTEALALYAGAAAIARLPGGREGPLDRALTKLGRALGVARGDGSSGVAVSLERGSEAHLETVRTALEEVQRLRMEYFTASRSEVTSRTVDPWGLIAARGHWYLVAGDGLSGDERMFRLDRIKAIEPTGEAAEVPADFDPAAYRGAFKPDPNDHTVSFEISEAVSAWFEEYYPVVSSEPAADGWRRVEITAGSDRWAAMLILQLGADVRRVEPSEVVAEVRSLAGRLAEQHT